PIDERPHFPFGVNEFIAYCQTVGAEPLMNVSEFIGTPQDSADLVEYLNAPADTKHPWAQKRAQWGHPEPFHVRYFEIGNESDGKYTPEQYALRFNECSRLMRAVDPTIKMSILMGTSTNPSADDPWNARVLTLTKGNADFIVIHTYAVCGLSTPDETMQSCMAIGDQFEYTLAQYRALIRKCTGRDIPLAITEYNCGFVQEKPIPYRFSYGAALFSADYLRILLKPETNVLMANYWQFINGYWGMVRTSRDAATQQLAVRHMPAYYLYRLWGQHFGAQLLDVKVNSPRVQFAGHVGNVCPAMGDHIVPAQTSDTNLLQGKTIRTVNIPGLTTEVRPDGTLVATLDKLASEQYVSFVDIPAPSKGIGYHLSFEARATGTFTNAVMGLQLLDIRGWEATHSAIACEGIQKATDWKEFNVTFNSITDSPGVSICWRLIPKQNIPVSGTLEVRNLRITTNKPTTYPAYPAITASASRSADGKTVYLIVFNKHHAEDITTTIAVNGLGRRAHIRRWTVTGPSLTETNLAEEAVRETESGVAMQLSPKGTLTHTFPARSMTAFEFSE
ncbi:MAG TPA: alpha-L-arabinofuranosidase C-terminal domain-containing protein, partial [Armatimonadota bacterium]|nr:alpha-L-arabinofuranosidase C-terminal domain-containing protein [Armatimonadota bacterium]